MNVLLMKSMNISVNKECSPNEVHEYISVNNECFPNEVHVYICI